MFFALSGADALHTLALLRRETWALPDHEAYRREEAAVAALSDDMNAHSLSTTSLPFHLAAATGKLRLDEAFEIRHRKTRNRLFARQIEQAKATAAGECPMGYFPRYVWGQWPWQLRNSFNIKTYQRPEDVGCHFRQGPYNGKIRGWFTWSGRVALMIVLQSWGGALAADSTHLFYKWWHVAQVGLSPWELHVHLLIRKQ
ncbi:MAG TPA: hypothetical protein VF704_12730 [Allosphingosinicella sp.]|jgi:hypothetical protein